MRPDADDAAYRRDMVDACQRVAHYIHGKTIDDYRTNDLLRSAVERQVEIIGEAARWVSKPFQDAHPHVPWRPIIAQRHILAHEYGEVEHDLVCRVATIHVPALRTQLDALVPEDK